ncbi:MAG: discoidin domain-containing protein, partial [bacterium]
MVSNRQNVFCLIFLFFFTVLLSVPYSQPKHRIGIRTVNGEAEFFDKNSGHKFVPRGANFVQLGGDGSTVVDRLFLPQNYDHDKVTQSLTRMRDLGYNTVRVFVDNCGDDCIGDPAGGLSSAFLDNIADFLKAANQQRIYVILTSNDLPKQGGYVQQIEAQCCDTFDGYMNTQYLSPVGLAVYRDYWQTIVEGLAARSVPLEVILAYALRNEQFFLSDQPPLSLNSGLVTTANGKTYDMSSATEKSQMTEDGLAYWLREIRHAIQTVDSTALFTIGFFAPNAPNSWREDNRFVNVGPVFSDEAIDFLDFHIYPGPGGLSMQQYIENFGSSGYESKPIVLGEFGGFKFVYFSPEAAAQDLQAWQVESCSYGIDGWLHWHWEGTNDAEVWTGSEANEAINKALAVAEHPEPCEADVLDFFGNNIALHKPAQASMTLPDQTPSQAVDGWLNTNWGAGSHPPQWIEIDLETPFEITALRLIVAQFPDGETRHRVFGKSDASSQYQLLHEFTGSTTDNQVLEFTPMSPWSNLRYLKVETIESPSWVSWREIQVLSDIATNVQSPVVSSPPTNFALKQNYPNPFNPGTTIEYKLLHRSRVRIRIYNSLGELIRKLIDEVKPEGAYQVLWDGRDTKGRQVSTGIYYY